MKQERPLETKRAIDRKYYATSVRTDAGKMEARQIRNREYQRRRRLSERAREIDRNWAKEARLANVVKFAIRGARWRARTKGIEFDLTYEWAMARWTGKCELTGMKFEQAVGGQRNRSPSLDRIDPLCGYTQGNCRFVLSAINSLKGCGSDEEMFAIARALIYRRDNG